MNNKYMTLLAVMDGHGHNGARVSYLIKMMLPEILESSIKESEVNI